MLFSDIATRYGSWLPNRPLYRVLQEIASAIAAREAQIEVTQPLGGVLAQRTTVQQVRMNRITNALQFGGKCAHPRMRVRIEDNGIGVEALHADRMFHFSSACTDRRRIRAQAWCSPS